MYFKCGRHGERRGLAEKPMLSVSAEGLLRKPQRDVDRALRIRRKRTAKRAPRLFVQRDRGEPFPGSARSVQETGADGPGIEPELEPIRQKKARLRSGLLRKETQSIFFEIKIDEAVDKVRPREERHSPDMYSIHDIIYHAFGNVNTVFSRERTAYIRSPAHEEDILPRSFGEYLPKRGKQGFLQL